MLAREGSTSGCACRELAMKVCTCERPVRVPVRADGELHRQAIGNEGLTCGQPMRGEWGAQQQALEIGLHVGHYWLREQVA